MLRVLTILLLITAGLPRLGLGPAGGAYACADPGCDRPPAPVRCCAGASGEAGFCPMSNGPCVCAAAPCPDPAPEPDAPLPRSDRETVTGIPSGRTGVVSSVEAGGVKPAGGALVLAWTAGRSHNEVCAILGNWRT
jgi:hypothetical protein